MKKFGHFPKNITDWSEQFCSNLLMAPLIMDQDLPMFAAIAHKFCPHAYLVVRLKNEKDFLKLNEILWRFKLKL